MITPTTGSISIPAQTADGVWITNITIFSPAPNKPIQAQITICPFDSSNGSLFLNKRKNIIIPNIESSSYAQNSINTAMTSIFDVVQNYVVSKSIF